MNLWIIVAITIVILAIGGIFVAANLTTNQEPTENSQTCGNSCTPSQNCGQASCGAKVGRSCGCQG